jgi:seryl-tRNA synthetase
MAVGLHGLCERLSVQTIRSLNCAFPKRYISQVQARRPPTAPKQYPDLKHIRQNVDLYAKNCVDRNYGAYTEVPATIAHLAKESQLAAAEIPDLSRNINHLERVIARANAQQKAYTKQKVALAFSARERALEAWKEVKARKNELSTIEDRKSSCDTTAVEYALSLPNLTSPQTPLDGNPKVLSYLNHDPAQAKPLKPTSHVDIGASLSILDFNSSSVSTGWGFYFLLNEGALLEQALVQYALSVAVRRGWTAVAPPSVVYSYIADACGFQPRDQNDEQQIWQIEQADKDAKKPRRSLAATAEIPLAAMYAGKDIPEEQLPLKHVGSSRCYRAEAGARGVDTKGLYRVHEFTKVEMFAWTDSDIDPQNTERSTAVFDEMLSVQSEILSSLGLPCRVLEMPSSDLGASAYRKIDIEALFPSRMTRDEGWGEVTSVSICTDYQSRRLGTRILQKSGKRGKFPHTVNGTAMAIPRVLAAILEHGWREEERCVIIPEVLRPFMGGQERVMPKGKI